MKREYKTDPKVLVSILTYNNVEDTLEAVKCFRNQSYQNFYLQVVDNASPNPVGETIKNTFPDLEVVVLNQNHGYTGGNNWAFDRGLREGFNYVLISNHDLICGPDMLQHLVETAEKMPNCGMVGVIEENYQTKEIRTIGGKGFSFLKARGHWERTLPYNMPDNEVLEVDYVQGALILFSQKALQKGIRLDEKLFMYGEEIDLGFQIRTAGLKAYVDLRCRVRHKSLPQQFNTFQGYLIQRNRLYLARKYGTTMNYIFSVFYMGLLELPMKFVIRTFQGYPHYGWTCWLGFFDGLRGKMGLQWKK